MSNNKTYANLEVGDQEYKIKVHCFIELVGYTDEYLKGLERSSLIKRGVCRQDGSVVSFQITGFIISEQTLVVIFPKGYRLPSGYIEVMEHIKSLAGVLFRYKEEGSLSPEEKELLTSSTSGKQFGLAPALWLMKDYLNNGIIKREIRVKRTGHGAAIDWSRTVKTIDPYVTKNKPVYLEYVIKEKNRDIENKLIQLHRLAVKESFHLYGWLLNKNDIEKEIPDPSIHISHNEMSFILRQELTSTNADREINLIKMIQQFLLGSNGRDQSEQLDIFATPYFHNVWEKMCSVIFRNEYESLKSLIPSPVWFWNERKKSVKQIPDILYRQRSTLYILDAKYYDTTRTLPGWHDLVKQYFYAYSLRESGSNYVNVLVFPTMKPVLLTKEGHTLVPDRPDLGKIDAVSLNTYHVLKHYASYDNTDLRNELEQILRSE